MGQVGSRVHAAVTRRPRGGGAAVDGGEEADPSELDIYTRCESEGNSYFGSHFMMGGERCELVKPEASLFFVENKELDLLGDKPVSFPYSISKPSDTVIPLNLLVNIRKESIKFIKMPKEECDTSEGDNYNIYFVYDCDQPGFIRLHFNALEMMDGKEVKFAYKDQSQRPECMVFEFETGADQEFNEHVFNTADIDPAKMQYKGGNFYPIVIEMTTDGGEFQAPQTQTTVCTISQASDNSRSLILKPKRQRIALDGVMYLLQELFGLENIEQRERDEDGYECVVCRDDVRDTVILPCRHLCLCNGCADTLKLKANNCPICRKPFRALVQMKAKRAVGSGGGAQHGGLSKAAFEQLILVEALNGPLSSSTLGSTGSSSSAHEIADETEKRWSTRSKGKKVIGKKAVVEEVKETEDGIEMTSVEYFHHHPVNVVVVKPANRTKRDNSLDSDSSEDETVQRLPVISDPSSVESQDSSNALLKKPQAIV